MANSVFNSSLPIVSAVGHEIEKLKQKLFSSGLFDEKHKKKIPLFPKCVGIISSPTGAAVKDVITIIKRRSFNIDMIIYPTQTQGDKAQHQIVEAIDLANKRRECDVLILTRGGGTLEDIWSFNEESVANSVFNSSLPIVSAVGHEIDFTITDFVADLRASTPSAAAELVGAGDDAYTFWEKRNLFFVFFVKKTRGKKFLL